MLRDLAHVPDAVVTAVGSRSAERAEAFAAAHAASAGHGQVPTAHGSYRALLGDPAVDVVYVATPHPHHRALAAGKAILVEKSFTVTPAATREVVAAAGPAGRFAMEAMWTRFCPAVVRLRELMADGAIGEVCTVTADLGVRHPADPATQSYRPERVTACCFMFPPCPVFPPATAHDERECGWHFRALAAAEDSTRHVHFRVTPRMPGRRYLRLTDLPSVDDSSASGKSYRKEASHETDPEGQAPSRIGQRTARATSRRPARPGHRARPPDRPSPRPSWCQPGAVWQPQPRRAVAGHGQLPGPADGAGNGTR